MKPLSILTCVLIIAPAAALVLKGVDLLRFERFEAAMQTLAERAADKNSDRVATRQELNAMIREAEDWSSTPGLEARARQALGLLEYAKGPTKSSRPWWTAVSPEANAAPTPADAHLARLESIMIGLLAARPTDGLHWVELAKLRLARNAPLPDTLGALEMSLVTERLERATMSARAPVLLALWENLPDGMKRAAIRQFIDLNGNFEPNAFREFKAILSAKSAATRETLKEKIATQGAGAQPWMEKAGF